MHRGVPAELAEADDCIVLATDPGNHPQTFGSPYNPAFAAEVRVPLTSLAPMPLSARKIIARRAAMELRPNSVVNLGFGIPEGVASVAAEEKIADLIRARLPPSVASIEEAAADADPQAEGWLRVDLWAERLDWLPAVLASLDRPFIIEQPDELRGLVTALAERLAASARSG